MNPCGNCNMCCKIPSVPELKKPVNIWCSFCLIGKGCKIYESRPSTCREYVCLWLTDGLEEDLRPDKCKIIFEPFTDSIYLALCDASRPDAWKSPIVLKTIAEIAKNGKAVISKKNVFLPEDRKSENVLSEFRQKAREIGFDSSILRE